MSFSKRSFLSLIAAGFAATSITASADPFEFQAVDLLLGVQVTSGSGTSQNVFFNLGTTMSFRDGTNPEILGNISQELVNNYGNDWFTRADLRFGVAGLRSQFDDEIAPPAPGEDSGQTWYVSRAAAAPGSATLRPALSENALQLGGSRFKSLAGIFIQGSLSDRLQKTPSGATVLDETEQAVRWNNSWAKWNPSTNSAFNIWSGGIENNLGKGGSRVLVDVQRAVPNVQATYVVSIAIESDGTIRAVKPSTAASAFATWVSSFPALVNSTTAADRTAAGDFDKDGVTNIREFAFGGSPVSPSDNGQEQIRSVDANADTLRDFTNTIEIRSGATFAASGNKLTATIDGITYTIEGSLDLVTFNSTVSEVSPTLGTGTPKTGYVFKTFRLNAGNGLTGKGFIRAGAALN